jgi:hypothetical protein
MLVRCAGGFGAVAMSALLAEAKDAAPSDASRPPRPRPRARNVIFLYMDGGPSQMDTFDPKPLLDRYHGQDPAKVMGKIEKTQFADNGTILRSPWTFSRHGESGLAVSSLFPHIARHMDRLCVVRSMVAPFSEHATANYFLHTGSGIQGRPSVGSWVTYGLGSENHNLPGFVVIDGGLIPPGGIDNFRSGFLPAAHQGSLFHPTDAPVANVRPLEGTLALQRRKERLVRALDRGTLERAHKSDAIEAAITNYEIAARMQTEVPAVADFARETSATRALYGVDSPNRATATYARACLFARRLVERGVRFIELTCPKIDADRWDQHSKLKEGHERNARAVDQPIAGLLADLESRGLLHETLVVWAGEFGRTPFAQGSDGRDHNPFGFTIWLAGGGVKGGLAYGETDEWGYKAVRDPVEIHDLHATMLHLLGVDHERLTFRFGGRDMRLTDVRGKVLEKVIA